MSEIRTIYLLRHCEPRLPRDIRICLGRKDILLSDKGRMQAHNLKERFSGIQIGNIYSSPLLRAIETAEITAGEKGKVIIRDGFTELNTGKWDGLSFCDIKEKFPGEYEERGKNLEHYIIDGGESFAQCRERALSQLLKCLNESQDHIMIITHLGVIRMLISYVSGLGVEESFRIKIDYGNWKTLRFNGYSLTMGEKYG